MEGQQRGETFATVDIGLKDPDPRWSWLWIEVGGEPREAVEQTGLRDRLVPVERGGPAHAALNITSLARVGPVRFERSLETLTLEAITAKDPSGSHALASSVSRPDPDQSRNFETGPTFSITHISGAWLSHHKIHLVDEVASSTDEGAPCEEARGALPRRCHSTSTADCRGPAQARRAVKSVAFERSDEICMSESRPQTREQPVGRLTGRACAGEACEQASKIGPSIDNLATSGRI